MAERVSVAVLEARDRVGGRIWTHHLPDGSLLREPVGRLHWAGTETSTTSHGSIDGAVRSGERASAEILDR